MRETYIPLVMRHQETDCYCGPACMQAIGHHYGFRKSQDELFDIARGVEQHFKSIERGSGRKADDEGIGHHGIIAMARGFGLDGFIKNRASLDDIVCFIDQGVPLLFNLQTNASSPSGESGHYVVINGYQRFLGREYDDASLIVSDPLFYLPSPTYRVDYASLEPLWFDYAGKRRFDRWLAAFFPSGEPVVFPSRGFVLRDGSNR